MNPNQCYFNNGATADFYQCATSSPAGQSPAANPANWRKVTIPKKWRFALARLTLANLLKQDGQLDKAAGMRQEALQTERTGVEDLVREEATRDAWLDRISVQTNQQNW